MSAVSYLTMPYFPELYIDLNYKPNPNKDFVCTFRIESKLSFKEAATIVATESSIGTWTELDTLSKRIVDRLAPKIFYLNEKSKIAKIAYNQNLFEKKNVPQILSSVGGNIFGVKELDNLRFEDIEMPQNFINSFSGPAFGLYGIRKYFHNNNKLILGSIIKPKLGLTYKEHAELAYEVWKNGIDLVKDDENLTDLTFNPFKKRVAEVMRLQRIVEKETKSKKIHSFNITATAEIMLERAKYVKKMGGKCVMIDLLTAGYSGVQFIRNQNLGLIIHAHRAGHAAFTRNKKHGISMMVVAKMARLAGVDQLHTGTVVGKMEGGKAEIQEINQAMTKKWGKLKPVLPIASGGLYPGLMSKIKKFLGNDVIVNFGGGIHGHPDGSEAGARAVKQARDAVYKKITLSQYAKKHEELAVALEKWGE